MSARGRRVPRGAALVVMVGAAFAVGPGSALAEGAPPGTAAASSAGPPAASAPGETAAAAVEIAPADGGASPRRYLVSLPLLALSARSFALEAEGYLGQARRHSLCIGLGVRAAAGGDYTSLALSLSGEGRWWFLRPARGTGLFAAARVDLAHTSVRDELDDRALPATWSAALGVYLGWRWLIADRVSLAPTLGLGGRLDVPVGALAGAARPFLAVGFTVGWRL